MNDDRRYIPPLVTALVIAILPHLGVLPLWIIIWCGAWWGYRILSLKHRWAVPGNRLRFALTLAGLGGLAVTYPEGLGPNAFLGLLAVMAAVKTFEMSSHRDRMIVVFLAYFIVITALFRSETLVMTLYMVLSVFVTTVALVRINDVEGELISQLKPAGLFLAQALPLMMVLFLFFPRIDGSLFGLSRLQTTAVTGFSEDLGPGSVSRLAENNAVAFRAFFKEDMPLPPYYWRGIVFQQFDGRRWHRPGRLPVFRADIETENPIRYSITLEPHDNHWLFALDRPVGAPRWTTLHADYTLRSRFPVRQKINYDMVSTRQRPAEDPYNLAAVARQLPPAGNPVTRRLALQLTQDADTVDEKIRRILSYFNDRGFVYSLTPPPLRDNPVDRFMTETREGYCEHFASAFAFMMRVAGVPARIVGGYLGGDVNPYSDYLIVRQSHAHVWVEVWQADGGWIRVDPTAVVAPDRIDANLLEGPVGEGVNEIFFSLLRMLQFRWDAVATSWEAWFSGYAGSEQRALLRRLGLAWEGPTGMSYMLILLVALSLTLTVVYLKIGFVPFIRRTDPVAAYYRKFCDKLKRAGLEKDPAVGAGDFAEQVAGMRPDLAAAVHEITALYIRMRFEKTFPPETLKVFKKRVRDFSARLP